MAKRRIKRILALLLVTISMFNIVLVESNADGIEIKDPVAGATEVSDKFDILNMDRTIALSDVEDQYAEKSGFDVTLSAYVDGISQLDAIDIVLVVDGSNSLTVTSTNPERQEIVSAMKTVIDELKRSSPDSRCAMVTFGDGLKNDESVYNFQKASDIDYNSSEKGSFGAAFSEYISWFGFNSSSDGTQIYEGFKKAKNIFDTQGLSGRTKVCILLTDGVPTDDVSHWFYSDDAANKTLETAADLKKDGVIMFTSKVYFNISDSYKDVAEKICKYCSSAFGPDAIDINKEYEPEDDNIGRFVSDASNASKLTRSIVEMLHESRIYPFTLNETGILQDVVTPYFTISNVKCEIQRANLELSGSNVNIGSWSKVSDLEAKVDGQRVYVTGFDYIKKHVGWRNQNNSERVVLTYHIDPIEGFFGGTKIPTNIGGTTANKDYKTGGAGIYCGGEFLKAFKEQYVNIKARGEDAKFESVTTVNYGSELLPTDLFGIKDIESGRFDGVNNAFVNTRIYFEWYREDFKIWYIVSRLEINAGQSVDENCLEELNSFKGIITTSSRGVKYRIRYVNESVACYFSSDALYNREYYFGDDRYNQLYYRGNAFVSCPQGTVKTDTEFTAKFKYVGEQKIIEAILEAFQLPEIEASQFPDLDASQLPKIEILEKDPDGFIKLTGFREDIESYVAKLNEQMEGKKAGDIAEALGGSADGLDDFTDINFLGWELVNEKGTELRYEGEWSGKGQVKVNVYTADLNYAQLEFEYPSTPDWHFTADVPVGSTTQIVKTAKFGYDPIDFEHSMVFYYYDENDSFQELTDDVLNANYGGFSKDANGVQVNEYIQYGIQYKDAETGETKIKELEYAATVNTNFCNECGGLVTSAGATSRKDGELLYECPHCGTTNPTIEFSDYELDEALSSKDALSGEEITVGGVTTINLYIKPCEHEYTVTVTIDDKTNVYTAPTFTDYFLYDTAPEISDALWDVLVDSKTDSVLHNFPYVQVEALKPSGFFSPDYICDGSGDPFVGNTNYDMWFKTDFVDWVGCDPEEYDLYSVLETAFMSISSGGFNDWLMGYGTGHDLSFEVAVKTDEYDLDLKKLWADNVSEADKQTCIFALYEVNEEASDTESSYKLVTRFAVNPNNSNAVLSGLKAGKHYLIEEENWSYKTSSGCFRGGTNRIEFSCACASEESEKGWYAKENGDVLLGEDTFTYQVSCTNNINENWKGGMTSDKGVINKYNGTSIDCIPIIKKQKGDKLK